ncbi:MAG TPA: cell envelope integrity protein TolA [Candidatus Angelobacter sp.]
MYRILLILSALPGLVWTMQAQTPAPDQPDQQETIRQLVQEVRELKARIAVLEARQAKADETVAEAAQAKPVEAPPTGPAPAAAPTGTQESFSFVRGVKLQGFGSLSYKANDAHPPELGASLGPISGTTGTFSVGDVDLFLTSQLTSRASILAEVVFSEQTNAEFEVDVERLLLKFNVSDYLKMSFGRFHTGTSYYNSVFHHGFWLQTAADRPLVVEFSDHGGLLPSQAVGASLTGKVPSGTLGLNYIFEYGSAGTIRPQITSIDAPEIQENNGNEFTAGFFFQPDWLPGLNAGGSFYHDHINPEGTGLHMEQSIGSAHVVYNSPRFEFLNEAFLVQHKVAETGQEFNTTSFYSLISQKILGRWRPYFRYQYSNAPRGEPVFPDIGMHSGPSSGMRFEANDYIALKIQYDRIYRRDLPAFNNVLGQVAFRF